MTPSRSATRDCFRRASEKRVDSESGGNRMRVEVTRSNPYSNFPKFPSSSVIMRGVYYEGIVKTFYSDH